jgi:hypothetical protein
MARMRGGGPKRLKLYESLRDDNEADGPFAAQPAGTWEGPHPAINRGVGTLFGPDTSLLLVNDSFH